MDQPAAVAKKKPGKGVELVLSLVFAAFIGVGLYYYRQRSQQTSKGGPSPDPSHAPHIAVPRVVVHTDKQQHVIVPHVTQPGVVARLKDVTQPLMTRESEAFLYVSPHGQYAIQPSQAVEVARGLGFPIATVSQVRANWEHGAQICSFGLAYDDDAGSPTRGELVRVYPMQQYNCLGCSSPTRTLAQWGSGAANLWLYGVKPTLAEARQMEQENRGTISAFAVPMAVTSASKCEAQPHITWQWSMYSHK